MLIRTPLRTTTCALLLCLSHAAAAQNPIDDFFSAFTDQWVEANPNQAISSGYFTGDKQNQLEQQLTPVTREYRLQRSALARSGLEQLDTLDFTATSEKQLLAAELMRWQLETLIEEDAYLDYTSFPLQQMNGVNVALPDQLTIVHPLQNAQDAANYLLRLAQMDERMVEATADARRRAELGIVPPAFILQTTIEQMERFIGQPAAQHPLTTTLLDKTAALSDISDVRHAELGEQAAGIVAEEVYPAWQAAIAQLRAQLPRATDDAGLALRQWCGRVCLSAQVVHDDRSQCR